MKQHRGQVEKKNRSSQKKHSKEKDYSTSAKGKKDTIKCREKEPGEKHEFLRPKQSAGRCENIRDMGDKPGRVARNKIPGKLGTRSEVESYEWNTVKNEGKGKGGGESDERSV